MDDIQTQIEEISGKEAFLSFLNELIFDFRKNPKEWENPTVDLYLEAIQAWIEDASSSGLNVIDWNGLDYAAMAKLLYMGKIYE